MKKLYFLALLAGTAALSGAQYGTSDPSSTMTPPSSPSMKDPNAPSSAPTFAPQMKTSLNTSEDASVLNDIRNNLTNYQGVSVSVYRGDVTLRGTTASQTEKDRIEREVRRISGVRTVDNQIQVTGSSTSPARG